MKTINMRACDAVKLGEITRERYESLIKQHGLKDGRAYLVPVQVKE